MSDLRDLYQETILDHYKRPRNFGELEDANRHADGRNPLCGDSLSLWLRLDGDRIGEVRFKGQGCAISTASASLMTEAVKGKSAQEAEALYKQFHELVTGDPSEFPDVDLDLLDKLAVFAGVREFPARVKCASLAWHTLRAALTSESTLVTTE